LLVPKFLNKCLISIRWEQTEEIPAKEDSAKIQQAFTEKGFQTFELILKNHFLKKEYHSNKNQMFLVDLIDYSSLLSDLRKNF